jgi:serine/threonine protein kinase
MAEDSKDDGPARTVFMPPGSGGLAGTTPPHTPAQPPAQTDGDQAESAWFSGVGAEPAPPADDPGSPAAAKPRRRRKVSARADAPDAPASTLLHAAPSAHSFGSAQPFASAQPFRLSAPPSVSPGEGGARVSTGSVLNHIYEVRRFLARGGMGEVYEGVNVNTDERVAIKVILPHLAADANVQAMFRKEARTLTRLNHPALVQYRVLAQEPQLGVFYIVTEFVDGVGLDQVIGELRPSREELIGLMRRLAEGLRVAHDLGAVHRDISPDNILLPGGRLQEATIIDFGIAKDLDTSQATIVGDGFAGKLGYVAPEQLGAFNRDIGPWTDIYSLALVILSLANCKTVDMGSTLFDAVHRRQEGPNLGGLPDDLKPLFELMLKPDPKQRLRSMAEVLDGLANAGAPLGVGPLRPAAKSAEPRPQKPPKPPKPTPVVRERSMPAGGLPEPVRSSLPLIAAGAIGVVILLGGGLVLLLNRKPQADTVIAAANSGTEAGLRAVRCSWLQAGDGAGVFKGAAQAGYEAQISQRFPGASTRGVLTLEGQPCNLLDAVRPLAAATPAGAEWVTAITHTGEFVADKHPECDEPNTALAVMEVDTATGAGEDMALYLLRPGGAVEPIFRGKDQLRTKSGPMATLTPLGSDRVRIGVCSKRPGPYGLLALRGQGPFAGPVDAARRPLADQLAQDAKARHWRSNMAWFGITSAAQAAAPTPAAAAAPAVANEPVRAHREHREPAHPSPRQRHENPRPAVAKAAPKGKHCDPLAGAGVC